ncbi:amidohydrolase family protein [Acuticoccus sp. MNP-M23]|uniref:amidohydrolase family protein n=1 Tax=Acuticoccus sp. MNP-M23 TaxID=3072793 RepID=UPI00281642C5|nr:amidohydrolase family protein [Acuticoccus sp. MNP-M23]WMS41466.1 amidohydrolase family protein [Acuticoccus sp. MNP-M23]
MPDFPILDTHLHLIAPDRLDYPWLSGAPKINKPHSLADYDVATGAVDVDAMVFLEVDVNPADALEEARYVTEQAERDPRIRAMVPFAPLETGAAVADHLAALAEFPLTRGVRRLLQGEADPEFCLLPDFLAGVKALEAHDFSFDICVTYRQMASTVALARACPGVKMVLDHIGKPAIADGTMEPWASQIRALAAEPNTWLKLSGVATEADHDRWTREELKPFIVTAVEAFGIERTMFGGDWPVSTHAITYPEWVDVVEWALALTPDESRQLFRGTGEAFYRL